MAPRHGVDLEAGLPQPFAADGRRGSGHGGSALVVAAPSDSETAVAQAGGAGSPGAAAADAGGTGPSRTAARASAPTAPPSPRRLMPRA